jgi:PAS domain S-box-containing protein
MKLKKARELSQRDLIFASAPGLEATEFLFDTISDVLFCVKDRERRYVAANEAFLRRAGLLHRNELLGKTARELFPAVLAAGYEQQDEEVFSKGTTVRDRLEMITTGGSVGWFVSQKIAVKNAAGEIVALAGISRDLHQRAVSGAELGPLGEVLDTLHRDCGKPLRIEALARQAGLSWSQFERRVRGITGLTPRQLLTKSRIEMAAARLRAKGESLSSIAYECGFYDQAAFSRQFRAVTGLSPGEYRRAAR